MLVAYQIIGNAGVWSTACPANNKENIKVPHHWSLWEESTSDHYHSQRVSNITMTSHERHVVPNHWPFHCLCNIFCGPHQRNTEVHITGPLWGEFTGRRWTPPKKGQWRGKCFHVMTSSRKRKAFPYYNLLCYHNGIIFLAVTNNQL